MNGTFQTYLNVTTHNRGTTNTIPEKNSEQDLVKDHVTIHDKTLDKSSLFFI